MATRSKRVDRLTIVEFGQPTVEDGRVDAMSNVFNLQPRSERKSIAEARPEELVPKAIIIVAAASFCATLSSGGLLGALAQAVVVGPVLAALIYFMAKPPARPRIRRVAGTALMLSFAGIASVLVAAGARPYLPVAELMDVHDASRAALIT